uniref:Uncharacterized protein n=1 Tax=Oryza punctata TaxID=4537 RepID=A0A0E0KC56_ORYPU
MDGRRLPVVPAIRVGSQLHLAAAYTAPGGGRRGSSSAAAGPPPALMANIRVVVRRHFPVGPNRKGTVIVQKVAEDIAVRRQPSRGLRSPESVERVLAERVLPFVEHPFDRRAVAVASKQICAYVSAACADPRVAHGGVRVLVLVDTFACGTLFHLAPPRKQCSDDVSLEVGAVVRTCPCMEIVGRGSKKEAQLACPTPTSGAHGGVVSTCPCMDIRVGMNSKKPRSVGVIGDGRPAKDSGEDWLKGWVPW